MDVSWELGGCAGDWGGGGLGDWGWGVELELEYDSLL